MPFSAHNSSHLNCIRNFLGAKQEPYTKDDYDSSDSDREEEDEKTVQKQRPFGARNDVAIVIIELKKLWEESVTVEVYLGRIGPDGKEERFHWLCFLSMGCCSKKICG